jgi:hypothetical protein
MKMKFKIFQNVNEIEWNNNLLLSDYSTFFQTAEFLSKKSPQRYPVFIYVYNDDNEIQGQLGLMISKSKTGYSTKILKKFVNSLSKIGGRGSWVSGPIIYSDDELIRIEVLQTIFSALEKIAKEHKLMIIDGYTPPQDSKINQNYLNEFTKNDFVKQDFITLMSYLGEDLDELWKKVKKNSRNDVTKAKRENIVIKEISTKDELINYKQLTKKWAKTKGIDVNDTKNVNEDWSYLKNGIQKFFLAYSEDEIVAGLRIGCFNKIVYTHQVLNSYSKIGNVAGPLLTWHAIEWAKNSGMNVYDFSGGEAPPSDKKNMQSYEEQWSSLFAYKRKWGGNEVPYYHFVKIFNKERYKLYRVISKPDTLIRNYKKRHYKRPQGNK